MKLIGVLFALALCAQYGLADISLKLRNEAQPRPRPRYLPPTSNGNEQLLVKEQYYKLGGQRPTQQIFEESNYGNSRYQIFEVHNHYEAPTVGVAAQPQREEIHIHQQLNNDDHLELSLLDFADNAVQQQQLLQASPAPIAAVPFPSSYQHSFPRKQQQQQQSRQQIFSAAGYLPPTTQATQLAYQPQQHQQQHQQQQRQQQQISSTATATATNQVQTQAQSQRFQAPGYLPPTAATITQLQQQHHQVSVKPTFAAPGYLPPATHATPAAPIKLSYPQPLQSQPLQQQILQQQSQPAAVSQSSYRAPGYLPPTTVQTQVQTQQQQVEGEYRAPGYLPPSYVETKQQQPQQQIQQQQLNLQPLAPTAEYHAPGYLPPGYDYPNPDQVPQPQPQVQAQAQAIVQSLPQPLPLPLPLPQQLPQSLPRSLPQSLPQSLPKSLPQVVSTAATYRAPGYLPPGYEFGNPEQVQTQPQAIVQTQTQSAAISYQQTAQQQQHHHHQQQQTQQQQILVAPTQPTLSYPGALPAGYEFSKPENSEAAIAELHSLQTQTALLKKQQQQQQLQQQQQAQAVQQQQLQQVVVQSQISVAAHGSSDIIYGRPKPQQQPLAPQSTIATSTATATATSVATVASATAYQTQPQQQQQQYSAPGYLPPSASVAPAPAPAPTQVNYIHSLSSFMNNVQPNARYAQPAPAPVQQHQHHHHHHIVQQQQLPQQQQHHHHVQQVVEVAPMYREQSKRPRFYAPAMSYVSNPVPQAYQQHVQQQQHVAVQQQHVQQQHVQQQQVQQPRVVVQQQQVQQQQHVTVQQQQVPQQHHVQQHQVQQQQHAVIQQQHVQQQHVQQQQVVVQQQQIPQQQQHVQQQHVQQQQVVRQQVVQQQHVQQQHVAVPQQHVQQQIISQPPLKLRPVANALSFEAQQSLQKFMPKDLQLTVNMAVAAAPPASLPRGRHGAISKIRTVQIVKPNSLRTFKVLETLDQGVKTIKILGATNEQPTGPHQIVKVVTQNAQSGVESHVQTVRIYDEEQPATSSGNNAYLPPARPRTRIVRQAGAARTSLKLLPVARSGSGRY